MKKIFLITAFILLTSNVYSQEVLELNLQKSIELALEFNHDLKLARLNNKIAEEQVSEAWGSSVFPKISGLVSYSRAIKRGQIIIETPFFSGSFPAGTENTMTLSANLEQPLFTGAVFLAVRIARNYEEITKKNVASTREEVIVNVKKAYYSLLLAREVVTLSELNLKLAEDNLKNTESMFNAGVVPEYDFIRAKVQYQNLIPELQSAKNSVDLAENMLRFVLGLDLDREISLKDNLSYNEIISPAYTDASEIVLQNNHSLKQLELRMMLQDDAVSYEFSKHFPELYFVSNWQTQAQENDPRSFNKWRYINSFYVGLNLRVPIFDGFQTTSKVEQAKLELLKYEEEYQKSSKLLRNNLRDVLLSIAQTRERINSFKATIEQAELGYDIATKRYSSGVGTQLELVDAMVSLSRAKVNYFSALYDYYVYHAELDMLMSVN